MNKIHLGNLIAQQLIKVGMTKAEFGRRIGTSRQNVNTLLKKQSINTDLLIIICKVLNHNFFDDLESSFAPIPKTPVEELLDQLLKSFQKAVRDGVREGLASKKIR